MMISKEFVMKLIFLIYASVIIEDNGVKIISDPWLVDDEFYGFWTNYPTLE